mgnify:CR=1 FL=1
MSAQTPDEKYDALVIRLRSLKNVAVAFSGGVDSTLLLHAAHEALGDRTVAITARSRLFPQRELDEAVAFCNDRDIPHVIVNTHELEDEMFRQNPPNRCYICKTGLLRAVIDVANGRGVDHIVEGSNTDDESDYRPGAQAILEQGVMSPLKDAGLSKREIRDLSREKGLPTWSKQSFACLASRFAFGEVISEERLGMIDAAEQILLERGIRQVRVRFHGAIARIEVQPDDFAHLVDSDVREDVIRNIRALGFKYVTLDLGGYQTGSMNMTIGGQTLN